MKDSCLSLLPAQKKTTLSLYSAMLSGLIESQDAFFKYQHYALFGKTPLFNLLIKIKHDKSKTEFNHYQHYLIEKQQSLKKILVKKIDSFESFLKKHELIFPMNAIDQYLFILYFLKNKKKPVALVNLYKRIKKNIEENAIDSLGNFLLEYKIAFNQFKEAKSAAQSALRSKMEFVENMRHDIRTPLTGMIGFAQLIQQESLNSKMQGYADNLVSATKAFLDFQNDILDTIETLDQTDKAAPAIFDLPTLIQRAIDLIRPKAILKKLDLEFNYEPSLPSVFSGRRKRLFRIVLELITNALKFTAHGKISVSVRAERIAQSEMLIRIDITDTGIGIPADKIDDIFLRFNRLSPSSDGVYEGMGLGLTVVKKIVAELKGKMQVTSETSRGSTFSCFIPLTPMVQQKIISDKKYISEKIIAQHHHFGAVVLLVEDHEMTATVTKLLLTDLGCRVNVAADFKSALLEAESRYFDLILMDFGLPDGNGVQLAQQIKQKSRDLYIVGLTAHIDKHDETIKNNAVLDEVIEKPLLKSAAILLLQKLMKRKPIIDLKQGAKKINQDKIAAKSMLELLIDQLPTEEKKLMDALHKKDYMQLRALTHKMLGGLAYCGAPRLENACRQLYLTIKNQKEHFVSDAVHDLLSEIDLLRDAINR